MFKFSFVLSYIIDKNFAKCVDFVQVFYKKVSFTDDTWYLGLWLSDISFLQGEPLGRKKPGITEGPLPAYKQSKESESLNNQNNNTYSIYYSIVVHGDRLMRESAQESG